MKKSFTKKLSLSKFTVSNLDSRSLTNVKGGIPETISCPEFGCETVEFNCTLTCLSAKPVTCDCD